MSSLSDLIAALASRSFELVETPKESESRLLLHGRVPPKGTVANQNIDRNWLMVVQRLIAVSASSKRWSQDISKLQFNEGDSQQGRLRWAWRIILQAPKISSHYDEIIRTIMSAPKSNMVDVMEFPLTAGPDRNNKGNVGPSGTVAVGPAAVRRPG